MTQPYDVEFASPHYQQWLGDLKQQASLVTHNQSQAMMRAVMHQLRRTLTPDQVLTVANALPALPRGIFIEGWSLDDDRAVPVSSDEFTAWVADDLKSHHVPPESIVADVFAVWARHLDPRQREAIVACLPASLKALWPETPG